MPSSLVHATFGALVGLALLQDEFDEWALLAVVIAAIFPDIDSFIAIWFPGMHRTLLHNIFIAVIPAFILFYATQIRGTDFLERHWGAHGERVVWTCIVVVIVAHVGLDVVESGTNIFWPMYDQFFHLTGILVFSAQSGVEQTFYGANADLALGTTEDMYYVTPVDPAKPDEPVEEAEIVIPFFGNGYELLLTLVSLLVVGPHIRRQKHERDTGWFPITR
jgi:hypothetical protein